MEWIIGPSLILYYVCSFWAASYSLYEKTPRQARRDVPWSNGEFEQTFVVEMQQQFRRKSSKRKEPIGFDWKKEGF